MGLLDIFNSDEGRLGLSLLGAAGPSNQNFAGRMAQAGQSFQGMQQDQRRGRLYDAQLAETLAQVDERKARTRKDQEAVDQAARLRAAIPGLFGGMPGAMPQEPHDNIERSLGRAQTQATPGGFDVQRALALGMDPKMIAEYAGLQNLNRPEVARTLETMKNGRPVTMQFDKYGQAVGDGMEQWKAPVMQGLGNRTAALDPVTLQERGSFPMGQSPDSVASNSLGWANHRETKRHHGVTEGHAATTASAAKKPQFVDGQFVYAPDAQNPAGRTVSAAGFSPTKNMTEDQGKATGWLVQAENAWKNMRSAGMDKDGQILSAARPGFNDALAAIPSLGLTTGAANIMRGADRQKFMQGSSSLSEALLRAATGAGVNQAEAEQKVREITPVIGDDNETVKQKMAAIPLYIETLKVRAGPGAKSAGAITQSDGSADWEYINGKLVKVKK